MRAVSTALFVVAVVLVVTAADFYEQLGVSRQATPREIKKAFHRLSRQYHPDHAPADRKDEYHERFTAISEAYAVLSDPDKRRQYDRYGAEGASGRSTNGFNGFGGFGGRHHFDMDDLFKSFGFEGFGSFDSSSSGRRGRTCSTKTTCDGRGCTTTTSCMT